MAFPLPFDRWRCSGSAAFAWFAFVYAIPAQALTVLNFEPGRDGRYADGTVATDDLALTDQFAGRGISFAFDNDLDGLPDPVGTPFLEQGGDDGIDGFFNANFDDSDRADDAVADQFGEWSMRWDQDWESPELPDVMLWTLATPSSIAGGQLWDLDGADLGSEQFRIEALDIDNQVIDTFLTANRTGQTLDGRPETFFVTAPDPTVLIAKVRLIYIGTKPREVGVALDNLFFDPVPEAGEELIGDSMFDFGPIQGGAGWYYGYYESVFDPSGYRSMRIFEDPRWGVDLSPPLPRYWTNLQRMYTHPNGAQSGSGYTSSEQWPVRRFVSPFAGKARVAIEVIDDDIGGNGCEIYLFHNSERLAAFYRLYNFEPVGYSFGVDLDEGDTLDLAMSPAGGLANDRIATRMKVWARSSLPPFPQARVEMGSAGPEVVWPATAGTYQLQWTNNLADGWSAPTTEGVVREGESFVYPDEAGDDRRFFRLVR